MHKKGEFRGYYSTGQWVPSRRPGPAGGGLLPEGPAVVPRLRDEGGRRALSPARGRPISAGVGCCPQCSLHVVNRGQGPIAWHRDGLQAGAVGAMGASPQCPLRAVNRGQGPIAWHRDGLQAAAVGAMGASPQCPLRATNRGQGPIRLHTDWLPAIAAGRMGASPRFTPPPHFRNSFTFGALRPGAEPSTRTVSCPMMPSRSRSGSTW